MGVYLCLGWNMILRSVLYASVLRLKFRPKIFILSLLFQRMEEDGFILFFFQRKKSVIWSFWRMAVLWWSLVSDNCSATGPAGSFRSALCSVWNSEIRLCVFSVSEQMLVIVMNANSGLGLNNISEKCVECPQFNVSGSNSSSMVNVPNITQLPTCLSTCFEHIQVFSEVTQVCCMI